MNFSYPFIRRPIGTTLLAIGLFMVGAVAYDLLPVASLPSVDFPTINVSASRPGADPNIMAATVAAPLERRLGRNCRRHRTHIGEFAWLLAHHHPVRSQPQHRWRRARRAGRAQCRAQRSAGRSADAADVPQSQSGGGADPDPGADLQDHARERDLRRCRQRDRATPEPGRWRRRRYRRRLRAAGAARAGRSGAAGVHGARHGGCPQRHRQCQRRRPARQFRRRQARRHHRHQRPATQPPTNTTRWW